LMSLMLRKNKNS